MKTLQYSFFIAIASLLMAADCSNDDAEFYNDVFINVPDLVEIETRPSYVVGDLLWINTIAMRRYVDEAGQNTRLDLLRSSGYAPSYSFTYLLERKTSGDNWEVVNLQNSLVANSPEMMGSAVAADFVFATSKYNPLTETYDYRNAIRFEQPGDYRLSFGYNSASVNSVELRSDSFGNNLFVNINSSNSDIDSQGYYYITVN